MRYIVFFLMIAFQVAVRDALNPVSHDAAYVGLIITMAYLGWCYDRKQ